MEKYFEVKTTLSLEDNLALHRVHSGGQQKMFVLYSLLAAVIAVYLWVKQDKYALMFTALTVVLFLCTAFYTRILGRLSYNKAKAEISETTYSFYAEKIGVQNQLEDSLNDYKVFAQIQENSRYYFLYTKGSLVLVLPKRDFVCGKADDFGAFLAKRTGLTVKKLKK